MNLLHVYIPDNVIVIGICGTRLTLTRERIFITIYTAKYHSYSLCVHYKIKKRYFNLYLSS